MALFNPAHRFWAEKLANAFVRVLSVPLKDLPDYLARVASRESLKRGLHELELEYHQRFIRTDSPKPIYDVCTFTSIVGYLTTLPYERRHLQRGEKHGLEDAFEHESAEQEAKVEESAAQLLASLVDAGPPAPAGRKEGP